MDDAYINIRTSDPSEIEKESFAIISSELEHMQVLINGDIPVESAGERNKITQVIKRCIHTTADFDYAKTMYFTDGAVGVLEGLIRGGAVIVTDTNMALAGINKRELAKYGCSAKCYMSDEDVVREAAARNMTRAAVSMERAMKSYGDVIFVIGNAPTALIALREHYDSGDYVPSFVIGVPVGFVNVTASKELIMGTDIPCIVNTGRKGGSNVAAAVMNAVLYGMR